MKKIITILFILFFVQTSAFAEEWYDKEYQLDENTTIYFEALPFGPGYVGKLYATYTEEQGNTEVVYREYLGDVEQRTEESFITFHNFDLLAIPKKGQLIFMQKIGSVREVN